MTHANRTPLTAILLLVPVLSLAAAASAWANGLRYVEMLRDDLDARDGLNGAQGVAVSPDGRHVYVASKNDAALAVFSRDAADGSLAFVEVMRNGEGISGLDGARAVIVSQDGGFVYVTSSTEDTVAVFARDATSGALTFVEVQKDGVHQVNGLEGAADVALSPDGEYLYVAGMNDNAIAVFRRDLATGTLAFVQMRRDGMDGVRGLLEARALAVSPDGAHVYAASALGSAVAVFGRSPSGALVFVEAKEDGVDGVDGLAVAQDLALSPDGAHLYATGSEDDAVVLFRRDPATGTLTFVETYEDGQGIIDGINGAEGVVVSPDGRQVYVTSDVDDALAVFDRDPATGALTYVERHADDRNGIDGLDNAQGLAVSPDHTSIYVAGAKDDALVRFQVRRCGDAVVDPGEECDAGAAGSACCTAACTAEATGTTCDDGLFCTLDDTCAAGVCQGTARDCSGAATGQCMDGVCDEATAACVARAKVDGSLCEDGNPCTLSDICLAGSCTNGAPLVCAALDSCHDAGVCDPATGACSNPVKADGAACEDGNACTLSDTCLAGSCTPGAPVVCAALDQCRVAGVCDPATGVCSNPAKADGTACDDGSACTRSDTCSAGACVGTNPVVCAASDQCHAAGVCDPATGTCSNPAKADGAACNDGNACTRSDGCTAGACVGANPVVCAASDQCHDAGTCDPATGACSNPTRADGTSCDDGDACTNDDACVTGECRGSGAPDGDADGICDAEDACPAVFDPAQTDADGNGVGDACECTAPAPGRCIPGGGSPRSDCLLELNPSGPVTLNRTASRVLGVLRCADGDAACDRDGSVNGMCTFGLSVCLANSDPRLPRCSSAAIRSYEIMSPHAERSRSAMDQSNARAFEEMLAALGLEIRRGKSVVTAAAAPAGQNLCSPLVEVAMPAPAPGGRPVRRKLQMRATAADNLRDADRLVLECR
jgi:6-phosphogluconolactonase (cycloisomerase 2 family)